MEKGEWGGAAQQFGLALHAAKDAAQASQSSAYLTAVRLVEAQVRGCSATIAQVPLESFEHDPFDHLHYPQ